MAMPMMRVREVRMAVRKRLMTVPMTMRATGRRPLVVRMLVMGIMEVRVRMFHRLVGVRVPMLLGQVQPDAQGHQGGGDEGV